MTTKNNTDVQSLKINRLNQTQFSQAEELPMNELYFVDPEFSGNKVLTTDLTGDIVEADVSVDDLKLPSQTDNAGKVLETNGTTVSWNYRAIFRTWEG